MAAEMLQFRGYAPIPVGHTVELTYFGRTPLVLFGKSATTKDEGEPMVRDLVTGILYQTTWHVTGSVGLTGGRLDYGVDASADLPVMERRVVRVLACRVLCAPGFDDNTLVTTLLVEEPPAPEGPHR